MTFWLSMSFWNQFLGASEHIVLEFFSIFCVQAALSIIDRWLQISWPAQHLEHVMVKFRGKRSTWSIMIALMWPAQHFQQLLGRPVFACLIFLDFFGPKNRPFWMTGRSKSRPNDHLLDSWAGTSACDRPGIPPSPPKQRSKCRCSKESLSYFSQSLFGGVRGNVPKFEKLWRIRFQSNHFGWNNNSAVHFCYFASKK